MSTAEVVKQTDSNAQSAQDVQNVLAELKGQSKTEAATESATFENGDGEVAQARSKVETAEESETNELKEKNGTEAPDNKMTDEVGEDKKEGSSKGENGERSGEHRPYRGGGRGRGSGRGRGDYKSFKHNIKSDLTTQEETDDPVQIRKQVEFYFSDSNLPMDKFLLSQVGGSKNFPVDLKIIHSFKRMRHFQPFAAIPAALKESTFLELTDDDTRVKRKEPLSEKIDPEEMDPESIKVFEDRAMPRSVYVKGFGEEDSKTQLDIEAFFASYGTYNAIRLRRANDRMFKGSVFVEFDSEETQQKFLHLDSQPQYKGKDLQIMSKREYCEKKVDDIKSGKVKAKGHGFGHGHRGRGAFQNKRKRDDEDDRDWRERREDDRKNGSRDSRRGGRGGRGGKDSRRQGTEVRRDARGIPILETTDPPTNIADDHNNKNANSRAKREAATADALAKAKAMVDAENAKKKDSAGTALKVEDESISKEDGDVEQGGAEKKEGEENKTLIKSDGDIAENGTGESKIKVEIGASSTSKKRGRDEVDDDGDGDVEGHAPEAKRVDSKIKAEGVQGVESMES